jgi:hypothetical protein
LDLDQALELRRAGAAVTRAFVAAAAHREDADDTGDGLEQQPPNDRQRTPVVTLPERDHVQGRIHPTCLVILRRLLE